MGRASPVAFQAEDYASTIRPELPRPHHRRLQTGRLEPLFSSSRKPDEHRVGQLAIRPTLHVAPRGEPGERVHQRGQALREGHHRLCRLTQSRSRKMIMVAPVFLHNDRRSIDLLTIYYKCLRTLSIFYCFEFRTHLKSFPTHVDLTRKGSEQFFAKINHN